MSKPKKTCSDFIACVPQRIEADWDEKYGLLLAGFPLNLLFAAVTNDALVQACYWFAPDTFREDSQRKEMCYFTKARNDYFVRVTFDKNRKRWQTEKFKGAKLIRLAQGSTFEQAMIHTTMGGTEPDEPCVHTKTGCQRDLNAP